MKTIQQALQDHLDSGTTTLAWCWRVTRADGATFGFTDHDRDLTFEGTTFEPGSGFSAAELRQSRDLSVDAQAAEGALRSGRITEQDIAAGMWDDADVEVWRVNWQNAAERVLLRRGSIGQIRRDRHAFVAEVRSLSHRLNEPVGRSIQGTCDATLGDARCGVNLSAGFTGSGTVVATRGDRTLEASGLIAFTEGTFNLGAITWTSGANNGTQADVMAHAVEGSSAILTIYDTPAGSISAGDTFTITAGCDKSAETCASRFANLINFRGFPSVPGQDAILSTARRDGSNTGEEL